MMGANDDKLRPLISFHFHHHDRNRKDSDEDDEFREVPKGCLGILVGRGEEQRRFVIPVEYLNHPRFAELLKETEEEFGFRNDGPIVIPCYVQEFRAVQDLIDKESGGSGLHHRHHGWCF